MSIPALAARFPLFLLCALWLQLAAAQPFPAKPVRIIVPTSAGGLNDLLSRTLGQQVSEQIGRPVLVENRPGAGTFIGISACEKSHKADRENAARIFKTLGIRPSDALSS